MNVWVLSPTFPPTICGIGDHTAKMVQALSTLRPHWRWSIYTTQTSETITLLRKGITVLPFVSIWQGRPFQKAIQNALTQNRPDGVVIQYTPHLYHRLGINPDICRVARRLSDEGIPVYLILHELYVPMDWQPRHWITGPIQRHILDELVTHAHVAFVTTPERQSILKQRYPKARIVYLPVSSNIEPIPCPPEDIQALRAQWCRFTDERLLLFWGKLHPSKQLPLILKGLRHIKARNIPFQTLYIGPDQGVLNAARQKGFSDLHNHLHALGSLPETEVSRYLQAVDWVLYPLEDGASTRRGGLMAVMQHGTPVITTFGPATDPLLRSCANIHFAHSGDDFIRLADELTCTARSQHTGASLAMQRFFEAHYAWPKLADALLQTIESDLPKVILSGAR